MFPAERVINKPVLIIWLVFEAIYVTRNTLRMSYITLTSYNLGGKTNPQRCEITNELLPSRTKEAATPHPCGYFGVLLVRDFPWIFP